MNTNESFDVKTPRDALSLLSIKMYQKFGKEVLVEIEDVWHKLGISIGKKMKKNLSDTGLASVGQLFVDSGRKRGTNIDILELTDQKFHIKAYQCALGMKGKGRELCTAAMGCDMGIFEGATGGKFKMEIKKTVAAMDDCCEVIIEV
ncbi:MAG: hypothetical protein JJV89_01375 [Desulfosarcina sp.]|nr:hypothetical protein [Desulfobacterales bacterium]